MHADLLATELAATVKAELEPGERITWAGQPSPALYARRQAGLFFLGLVLIGLALYWESAVDGLFPGGRNHAASGSAEPFVGIVFLLSGLGLFTSPAWLRRSARRIAYIVTDRRAFVLKMRAGRTAAVQSWSPHRLSDAERKQKPDGGGDLIFERTLKKDSDGDPIETVHGFLAIRNVPEVAELVRQLSSTANREP